MSYFENRFLKSTVYYYLQIRIIIQLYNNTIFFHDQTSNFEYI